jgi:hypothetical protein
MEYSFYQYTSLPSENYMRVLELHPGQADSIIDCTLHQVELNNAPKYEAISYAWGDPTKTINVLCNGKLITVTQNLKDALLRFKLKERSRFVWADAICINQNDNVEKGSQVKRMDRIYANATRVCVWLGHATAEMQPAFDFIDEIEFYDKSTNTRTSSNITLRD